MTKLQKNPVVTNNTDENPAYHALELLKIDRFKNAILQILSDEIMAYRIDDAVFRLHNCFAPLMKEDANWDGLNKRNGYKIAIDLLDLNNDSEENLCVTLFQILYDHGYNSHFTAEMVARVVLHNWIYEIERHFSIVATINNEN